MMDQLHRPPDAPLQNLYRDIWATTKNMYAALAGDRAAEFERLLDGRDRLLTAAGAHTPDGSAAEAREILDLATKTSRLNDSIMDMLKSARDRLDGDLRAVRKGAAAARGYAAGPGQTGVIANVDG